ncbi:MAG TPA: WecB/TagA/CpsF family glycosyltransferase [Chloroflexota bacterium]
MTSAAVTRLPPRHAVADVLISATTYSEVTSAVMAAAHERRGLLVAATSVHGVVLAARNRAFREQLNAFDILTPDGQPLRWALNGLHGAHLTERVYGPTLMRSICEAAAREGRSIYLYGGRPEVLERLADRLGPMLPRLRIAGLRSPPFGTPLPVGDDGDVAAIRESGADVLFVALGCPRQEQWAFAHRHGLPLPVVCVGAAFDFHAGVLPQAPSWMQSRGLEWLFRLLVEPRRLWRRYTSIVPIFILLLGRQFAAQQLHHRPQEDI